MFLRHILFVNLMDSNHYLKAIEEFTDFSFNVMNKTPSES